MLSGVTVPQFDKAGRGGFMRRFLTLVCLLSLAIPAGISISGCTRNPAANYCNGAGYGMKITDVASITLQPATTGISMAFGQTRQVSSPSALTCKGTAASAGSYTYGTTDNQLVDISPSGNLCAGTWNRNSGGGIPNYTVCTAPNPAPSTGGLPYATAYISATAEGVTSNPVQVFVHAAVTSVGLVTQSSSGTGQQCFSQSTAATLDAQACYSGTTSGGATGSVQLCAPSGVTQCPYAATDPRCANSSLYFACSGGLPQGVTAVPNCTSSLGTLSYSVGTASVASITTNTSTNQVTITAELPGTTSITASVAGTGSSAGYFSTCPPKSISLTLADDSTSGTINQGATQNLKTITTDTNGNNITGLSLTYQSTDPIDISAGSAGAITATFPGTASVYAICQPPGCNPAPINEVGIYGTGLPIASNPVTITTQGTASEYAWFAAPGQSQYVVPIQLLTGTVGSTIRLPYVPNSMVMDQLGNSLYFGSPHELMVYSTTSGSVTTQATAVPGVVLAVSPNNTQVLVNDQARQLFYIYSVSGGSAVTTGGMGNAAAWTADSQTLYITDNKALNNATEGITGHTDTLYVYNPNTGWATYALPASSLSNPLPPGILPPNTPSDPLPANVAISSTMQTPAIVIPSMGAFFRGDTTVDHTWCPTGTVGNFASLAFYPQPLGDSVTVQNDALAATTDGKHILGAAVTGSGVTINDIGVNISTAPSPADANILTPISCPLTTNTSTGAETLGALSAAPALNETNTFDTAKVNATAVNQVVPSPESNLAFVTYTADKTNTNAYLPYYVPGTGGAAGTVGYVPLKTQTGGTAPIAPLAGAFTADDSLFFVSTAGDNMIHFISVPLATSNPATADTQQISPDLPSCISVDERRHGRRLHVFGIESWNGHCSGHSNRRQAALHNVARGTAKSREAGLAPAFFVSDTVNLSAPSMRLASGACGKLRTRRCRDADS